MGLVDVPEGVSGHWSVQRFEVTEEASKRYGFLDPFEYWRKPKPGMYTQLVKKDNNYLKHVIMSDTTAEVGDHMDFEYHAKGHVLINGLGIGVAIELIVKKVDFITIIELSPDVIKLVEPHYQAKYPGKIEVIQADALEYKPPKGVRYDAVWHDIWPDITADNLGDMHKLHRKYGRRTDWQGSWCRDVCEKDAKGYY